MTQANAIRLNLQAAISSQSNELLFARDKCNEALAMNSSLEKSSLEMHGKLTEYCKTVITLRTELQDSKTAQQTTHVALHETTTAMKDMKTALHASNKALQDSTNVPS